MNTLSKSNRLWLLLATICCLSSFSNNRAISQEVKALQFEVLQTLPHSTEHFTQGLFFYNGNLYESAGQYSRSKLIRYDDDFYTPLIEKRVQPRYFAEGATEHRGVIYQLTWRAGIALAYDPRRFSKKEGFTYQGEGWGLTSDGESLWMSNGSAVVRKLNTLGEVSSEIRVTLHGQPLDRINELEWIEGQLYANRWFDHHIYQIDPQSGTVTATLSLESLADPEIALDQERVLNGIAWNPATKTLWVTGKYWQFLYELNIHSN